jgi:hypothetical protein
MKLLSFRMLSLHLMMGAVGTFQSRINLKIAQNARMSVKMTNVDEIIPRMFAYKVSVIHRPPAWQFLPIGRVAQVHSVPC